MHVSLTVTDCNNPRPSLSPFFPICLRHLRRSYLPYRLWPISNPPMLLHSLSSLLSPLFSLPTYIYISYMLFLSAYTPPTLSDAWDLVLGQVATPSQQLSKGHRQPIPPYLPVHLIQPSSLIRIWHLLFFYTNLFLPSPSFPQPPFQLHGLFFSAPQSLCFSSAMRMHTPFPPVFQPCS